jgi:hypothetical protein
MASAGGTQASRCALVHEHVMRRLCARRPITTDPADTLEQRLQTSGVNNAQETVVEGILSAWYEPYAGTYTCVHIYLFVRQCYGDTSAYVLFVVETCPQNMLDKRPIEYALNRMTNYQLLVIYLTLAQCDQR